MSQPYVATYIALRVDEAKAGRELMRRVAKVVTSAANPTSPLADTWVSVALTHQVSKRWEAAGDINSSFFGNSGRVARCDRLRATPGRARRSIGEAAGMSMASSSSRSRLMRPP